MSDAKTNPNILRKIKQYSESDEPISNFLTELIIEEASHAKTWWWKESYKTLLQSCIKNWGTKDEN